MSKLVTFEQAKKLNGLGCDCYEDILEETPRQMIEYIRKLTITVSSALDWIREEKKIECGVYPFAEESKDEQNPIIIRYEYRFISYQRNPATKMNDLFCKVATFDTHPLAESALLDAVLTYLEKK